MKMKCSICYQEGHIKTNKKFHPKIEREETKVEMSLTKSEEIVIEEVEEIDDTESILGEFEKLSIEPETIVETIVEEIPKTKRSHVKITKEDKYSELILKEQFRLHTMYVKSRIESSNVLNITFRFPCIPEDISENIIKFILHKNGDKTSKWSTSTGDLHSDIEGIQECKCFTSTGPLSFTPKSEWDIIYFLDAQKWLEEKFVLYKVNLKRTSEEWKNIKMNKKETFEDQRKVGRRPRINWYGLYSQIKDHTEKIFDGTFDEIFKIESE